MRQTGWCYLRKWRTGERLGDGVGQVLFVLDEEYPDAENGGDQHGTGNRDVERALHAGQCRVIAPRPESQFFFKTVDLVFQPLDAFGLSGIFSILEVFCRGSPFRRVF